VVLDAERWKKINSVFERALAEPHPQRVQLVDQLTEDAEIRAEVRKLLVNHDRAQADNFLRNSAYPEPSDEESSFVPLFSPGEVLADRFRIIRYVAHGGMGEVYEAEDTELGSHVAVKTIRPIAAMSAPQAIARFKREVHLSKQVTHPNVCRVHDFFRHTTRRAREAKDVAFVSMEMLAGETLGARLRRTVRLSQEEAFPIVIQVASALEAAHKAHVLHRDLKPGNIFLVSGGDNNRIAVVTDFGLAMALATPEARTDNTASVPELFGTPGYMSPEQLQNKELTTASDVYSFGLVMYRMLTGVRPFEEETPFMERLRRINEPVLSPRAIAPELGSRWETVVLKCLERDPSRRFQTAGEIERALRGDTTVRNTPRPRKSFYSVAVLPLHNQTGDAEMEYLGDGITEIIISSLSRISRLRVMANSTVLRYKRQDPDPRSLGRQLEVGYVLVGRVSQRGKLLHVSAELVDVHSGWQIWGERYERPFEGIFDVQEDIAREISTKVLQKLTGDEKKNLTKKPTLNPEAFKLYLKGRHAWNKRMSGDIEQSIEFFQRATQIDPQFAAAYSGLADAYTTQGFMQLHTAVAAGELMIKAQSAAAKALSLDESLGEAYASLGVVALRYSFDVAAAERSFLRAIALNPGYAVAHHWYGECLAAMGRSADAVEQLKKALDLDPLSPIINAVLAAVFYLGGRYSESITQSRMTLQEIQKDFWPALQFMGLSQEALHEYPDAIETLQRAVDLSDGNPMIVAALAHAFAVSGATAQAQGLLGKLELGFPKVSDIDVAVVATGLGDFDMAFTALQRSVEHRSPWLVFLNVDPRFEPVRSDPRFQALARVLKSA
jgi:serine/threonine protein kinase/Flp pilus assembly protein TadD